VKRDAEAPGGDRLDELVRRHDLAPRQHACLRALLSALGGNPHAPTAVRDPATAVDVHLADSLAGLGPLDRFLADRAPVRVADIGSGAGLPGIPLAIARPSIEFDLVEATGRKCAFLEDLTAHLDLRNARVRRARAEELPAQAGRESYGAILARAVAPLATLVEYAGPLLEQGGGLIAWKGRPDSREERAGQVAAAEVGLELVAVEPVTPYEQSRNRHLYLYRKVRPCPARFPRRPGLARRKPLA
jgi:16S rRNA (guanine527-N7)-methyltransferase